MEFTTLKTNLEKLGYKVSCFDTAAQAAAYLNQEIDQKTVGFGGSCTLQEMGLYESLSAHNQVFWHWKPENDMTAPQMLAVARSTEVYLSSVNGAAETGELINIDGNGNRVSEIAYGHKKVYLIVGENKIAPDYDSALYRVRNVAAPLNARRLNKKTPCAVNGDKCYDCKSPERICKVLSVLMGAPACGEYEVVLVHEKLGY